MCIELCFFEVYKMIPSRIKRTYLSVQDNVSLLMACELLMAIDHESRVARNCCGKYFHMHALQLLFTLMSAAEDRVVGWMDSVWHIKSLSLCSSLNVVLKYQVLIPLSEINYRSTLKVNYCLRAVYHTVGNF